MDTKQKCPLESLLEIRRGSSGSSAMAGLELKAGR